MSDTRVNEPYIRALLGTVAQAAKASSPKPKTIIIIKDKEETLPRLAHLVSDPIPKVSCSHTGLLHL